MRATDFSPGRDVALRPPHPRAPIRLRSGADRLPWGMAAPKPTPEEHIERISLSGVHVDITEAIRAFTASRFGPLLDQSEEIIRVNIRLNQDQTMGNDFHFTATGQVEIRGPDLVAQAEGKDAYGALDGLSEQLSRLLRRRQGRRIDKRNHPEPIELDAPLPKVEPERTG